MRLGDEEDSEEILALGDAAGKVVMCPMRSTAGARTECERALAAAGTSWYVVESTADERMLGCAATHLESGTATLDVLVVDK